MKISQILAASMLLFGLLVTVDAGAAVLTVSSYSMYNGATGSYDYRDFTYFPRNGVCDVTSAHLSGGTGKLTDGVSPSVIRQSQSPWLHLLGTEHHWQLREPAVLPDRERCHSLDHGGRSRL